MCYGSGTVKETVLQGEGRSNIYSCNSVFHPFTERVPPLNRLVFLPGLEKDET